MLMPQSDQSTRLIPPCWWKFYLELSVIQQKLCAAVFWWSIKSCSENFEKIPRKASPVEFPNKGQAIDVRNNFFYQYQVLLLPKRQVIKISMESLGNVCRSITCYNFWNLKVASAVSCLSIRGMNFDDWVCTNNHRL